MTFDALVVGAGLCGSWVAKELTSGGMTVGLVDAGALLPDSLFTPVRSGAGLFSLRRHLFRLKLLATGRTDLGFSDVASDQTHRLFLDRRHHPYATSGADFTWHRLRAVGGRGHVWGRVMLRMTERQLAGWPVSYAELAPYYEEVERLLELGGDRSTDEAVPDGAYVHHRSLNALEQAFCAAVERGKPERRAVVNHVAGYDPAALSPMLRIAQATGQLTLLPETVATRLLIDDRAGPDDRITGIGAACARTGAQRELRARHVILAASAFETLRVLLNSRSDGHPEGLGNAHGLLGTGLLEHLNATVFEQLPASSRNPRPTYRHNPFKLNEEPHGFYIPPVRPAAPATAPAPAERFGIQGTISADTGIFYIGAFGEADRSQANRLTLDPARRDKFGVPLAAIHFAWSDNDLATWRCMNETLADMTEAFCASSGVKFGHSVVGALRKAVQQNAVPVAGTNHECGGAQMGTDPETSVVDAYNRLWEAPNVLVCDAACFPTLPPQNPTATTMALAVRASRRLLAEAR